MAWNPRPDRWKKHPVRYEESGEMEIVAFTEKKLLKRSKGEQEEEGLQMNASRNWALTEMYLPLEQVWLFSCIRSHCCLSAITRTRWYPPRTNKKKFTETLTDTEEQ